MKKLLNILGIALLLVSCVKDRPEGVGEPIVPAPEDFEVIGGTVEFSKNNPNFRTDSVYLKAKFNSTVSVSLTFLGKSSGAIRTMNLITDELDEYNTAWYGEFQTGTTKFFRTGEEVEVRMSFFGHSTVYTDVITIGKDNDFSRCPNVFLVDPYGSDLQGGTAPDVAQGNNGFEFVPAYPSKWWFGSDANGVASSADDIDSPQGIKHLKIQGTAPSTTVYIQGAAYGDGVSGPYSGAAASANPFYPFSANPDLLYFNLFAYGDGDANSELYIFCHEADKTDANGNPITGLNLNRSSAGQDDGVQILPDFTSFSGWRLLSYRYSDLPFASYCAGTEGWGCGNKVHEPERIRYVSFNLQSPQKVSPVTARVDYCMFTIGGAFDPIKFRK